MSEAFTDAELLAQIRIRAFEGLTIAVMLTAEAPLRLMLRQHFTAVLEAIDAADSEGEVSSDVSDV